MLSKPDHDIDHLKRAIELEAGRSEILRCVARGDRLEDILNLLCEKSEVYNPEMKSSVLLLDDKNATLYPIASVSLPKEYCQALKGIKIGIGAGSCGTAAFSKKRVVDSDIVTAPNWTQYKDLAMQANLRACWSEPIMGHDRKVYGTFAMYYSQPKAPTDDDIAYIETCANLAAIVIENNANRQNLLDANKQLSQTVDERNTQLIEANERLEQVLEQQKLANRRDVNIEKANTTNMLLMGFAHEINTPLGVAITSSSSSSRMVKSITDGLEQGSLAKSAVMQSLHTLNESIELSLNNLTRASRLLDRFSEMDTKDVSGLAYEFAVSKFMAEFEQDIKLRYPEVDWVSTVEDKLTYYSQASFLQLLTHLVENSYVHGFALSGGKIFVAIVQDADNIHISYHDNGKGIDKDEREKVFQPFFSTQRRSGKVGLGLNIVSNIVNNIYQGQIELVDSPVGVRYKITLPRIGIN